MERLTALSLVVHICATFINELRDRLITALLVVRSHRLIARNARELFSSNRGISHLNEACRINKLSRGSNSGCKILIAFGFGH